MDGAAIDLFVFESDPVLEGVIRLAAAAAEGVGDVTVVTTIDVETWSALRPTIVVLDLAGGLDLSAVVERGTAILFAWEEDYSPTKPIYQFSPRRTHRNTLWRVPVQMNP